METGRGEPSADARRARRRCAIPMAAAMLAPGSSMTNSSPPGRVSTSPLREPSRMTPANACKA